MNTLTQAVINAIRMIEGWSGDADAIEPLLDEIQDELMRGLGVYKTPGYERTPEENARVDELLRELGLN